MSFKIGFTAETNENTTTPENTVSVPHEVATPRKSVVKVHFVKRNMTLAYYNDKFDLHCGDIVFVDGKLEGISGRVTEVNYNFKIKLSDYKRVISVADTDVHGSFFFAGENVISFNQKVIPKEKIRTWFRAPAKDEDDFVSGSDDSSFLLENLYNLPIDSSIAERGRDYYFNNKIRYICIDGTKGYAIVEGTEAYEVEFEYRHGEISNLTCSCYCSGYCKHQFAAMLQLRETIDIIEEYYADEYEKSGYFAALNKVSLFAFAIDSKMTGTFIL